MAIRYSQRYDAKYDDEKLIWLESKCVDPECEYCADRPEHPIVDEHDWIQD